MPERGVALPEKVRVRTVALFWAVGVVASFFTFYPAPADGVDTTATVVCLTVLAVLSLWFTRLPKGLFLRLGLVLPMITLTAVAALVYVSGGAHSFFNFIYFLTTVLTPFFYYPPEAIAVTAYTGLVALLPALYDYNPGFVRVGLLGFGVLAFLNLFTTYIVGEYRTQEKERHHLQVLAEASRLSANLNLASTLKNAVAQLRTMVDAEACVLYLIDKDSTELFAVETDFDPGTYGAEEDESTRRFRVKIGQGLTGWVAEKGEPLVLGDAERDPRAQHIPGTEYEDASYIVAPVTFDQRILGVLRVSRRGLNRFGPSDLSLVSIFANQAAVAITNSWLYESTKELVLRDFLTGLYNSRYLQSRLQEEMARTKRHGTPLSLMFMDCDGLKKVNDAFGHPVGDLLIKEVSESLQTAVRTTDVVVRYAGDEFIILMPQTASKEAVQVAERIRQQVGAATFCPDLHDIRITMSIGVATAPEHASTGEELLRAADDALYVAKDKGRNSVHLARESARTS